MHKKIEKMNFKQYVLLTKKIYLIMDKTHIK